MVSAPWAPPDSAELARWSVVGVDGHIFAVSESDLDYARFRHSGHTRCSHQASCWGPAAIHRNASRAAKTNPKDLAAFRPTVCRGPADTLPEPRLMGLRRRSPHVQRVTQHFSW